VKFSSLNRRYADYSGGVVYGRWSKVRWDIELMGSNANTGMDVCVRLFCVVLCVDRGLAID
jgi:hypothetical protein